MSLSKSRIEEIVGDMSRKFNENNSTYAVTCKPGCLGIFTDIEDAIRAAKLAQKQLVSLSMDHRAKIISAMRKASIENAKYLAIMANEETGFGRAADKTLKNILAAEKTPGIEDLFPVAFTGDNGLTLTEGAPYGVIGAITPSTNPSSTVINNSISMVAAGNGVVYNPHPSSKNVCIETIKILNEAIKGAGGPETLLCSVFEPTLATSKVIMEHKDVRILAVTGGEAVVNVAMKSGKKVIAAGPGNPPVIVDDTADIKKAAADITKGASFDNNILCIAEKEVFVFKTVAEELINEMVKNNCYRANKAEIEKIQALILEKDKDGKYLANKKFVGKSASFILNACNITANIDFKLVLAEVDYNHPFVTTELLMPVLAISTVDNLDEAISKAITAENGCKHTAMMHSKNISNLTDAAKALDTTIFVKNAPSYAGLGFEGEGYTTLTIATPTGEGLTSAKSFTRSRRCTLSGSFRII
ncbi:MAG: aldehyde dehydrogenase family protein [Clostridia bacterium]